jgi:peptidoglycan/LPS O-acetylase OafA/YrhL
MLSLHRQHLHLKRPGAGRKILDMTNMDQKNRGDGAISTGHRLLHLDGWRGISILAVFLGHFLPLTFIDSGRMGVELFFVLSGRLMAEILFIERFPLDLFYRRRFARVWPAMVFFVLVMWLAFYRSGPLQVQWIDVAGALTLSLNYVVLYVHRMPALEHIWSLCIEEWAYILLGLLALMSRRLRLAPLPIIATAAVLCVINALVQTALGGDYNMVYWRTDTRIASILMASAVYLAVQRRKAAVPGWLPVLAGCLGAMLSFEYFPDSLRYSIGTLCFAFAVATIDQAPAWLRQMLSSRPLRQIGLWSFSLYLWQQPFSKLMHYLPRSAMVVGAIACGLFSFYLVEQPLRRFLNNRWRKHAERQRQIEAAEIGATQSQKA